MSNTRTVKAKPATTRPRAVRKASAQSKDDPTLHFRYGDKDYFVNPLEVTALDELELKRVTDLTMTQLLSSGQADMVAVGALIWLAGRQAGEDGALLDVLAGIDFRSLASLEYDDAAVEDASAVNPSERVEP